MCGSCYESFPLATMALVFTWMRLQVIREGAESVDGLSPVERGCERWRPALQPGVPAQTRHRSLARPGDLGPNYYARRNPERTMHHIINKPTLSA
jgi:hypothetical protein